MNRDKIRKECSKNNIKMLEKCGIFIKRLTTGNDFKESKGFIASFHLKKYLNKQ
jgi:hypothetical protein